VKQCNLGYASGCPRLPLDRAADAVRFGVAERSATLVTIQCVFERDHRPAGAGVLQYDVAARSWTTDQGPCIQQMAERYLESYLSRAAAKEDGNGR
jgi:hypothetical protein